MQLPEDDEDTFELFVDWLYHLRYEMLPGSGPDDDDDDSEDGDGETDDDDDESGKDDQRYLQAIRLFVLADKYRICKLKSLVIERLFAAAGEFNTKGPTYVPLAYAYKNTTQGSGLRKLLVDFYTWRTDLRWYRFKAVKAFLQRHSDVAIDLLLNLAKHLEGDRDFYNPFEGDMPEEYKDEESGQES